MNNNKPNPHYNNVFDKKNNGGKNQKDKLSGQTTENETMNTSENRFSDILKLKAKNNQLEELVKQQKEELANVIDVNKKFISVLAHDLRSPFNTILNSLDILKDELNAPSNVGLSIYVDHAISSTRVTLSLLDNLLIWIVSQQKGESLNPIRIKLQDLFQEIISEANDAATIKNIIINQNIGDEIILNADLQMIKSILRNLVSNAIKFSWNYGEITVSALASDRHVEIAIEDNGIGISLVAQKQLFKIDSFHSTIGTNNEKGTGLGLLICKEFVELHGGNLWIESELNKKSVVKFRIPQYQ